MKKPVVVALVLLLAIGLVIFITQTSSDSPSPNESTVSADDKASSEDSGTSSRGTSGQSVGARTDDTMMLAEAAPPPEMTPETNEFERRSVMDYIRTRFAGFQTPLDDYQLEGLEVDADGIRLAAPKPGEDPARLGVMQSPAIPLNHPSNLVLPLWRGEVPEGTTFQVEMATSADGENWTQWFATDVGHDEISPTYPDGSPNPNYGATPGTPLGFGLELYTQVRYRITMASADDKTPVLESFEMFHSDSTDGEGYLANDPPPEVAIIEAAAQQTQQE